MARMTVALTVDLDGQCAWMAVFGKSSPAYMSRGDFDVHVGAPRLLALFGRRSIQTTWFVPGHTMLTYPEAVPPILAGGHEIAAHGCYHELVGGLAPGEEARLLTLQIEQHRSHVGRRPNGYRSPSWDFTDDTLRLLEGNGFAWDSSLMGDDFRTYHPRPMAQIDAEEGNLAGPPSPIIEVPVSWHLDDFPQVEFVPGAQAGLVAPSRLYEAWTEQFSFAYEHCPGGIFTLTLHPQSIGRGHYLRMLERFLDFVVRHDDIRFQTISDYVYALTD